VFIGIFFISNFYAQQIDCKQGIQDYRWLFKANKVKESYRVWSAIKIKCEKEDIGIYLDGLVIIQGVLGFTKSQIERERLIREGLKLYEEFHANFPLQSEGYEVGKAMLMYNYSVRAQQQMEEIFILLDTGFAKSNTAIIDMNAINLYFELCYAKYKSKEISVASFSEKYFLVATMLNRLTPGDPNIVKLYKQVKTKIDAKVKPIISCNAMSSYYEKELKSNTTNSKWLIEALDMLSNKCSSLSLFSDLATALYQIKPTSTAATYRGLNSIRQKKYTEAIQFYEEAALLETNATKKATIYLNLATQLSSVDRTNSRAFLFKSLQVDIKMGKAYLLLAQLYAASAKECAISDFDTKVLYYLAITKASKAAEIDAKLQPQVSKFIEKYKNLALSTKEIHKTKLLGKSVPVGCWINEEVQIN
jgi:hypothetical protein